MFKNYRIHGLIFLLLLAGVLAENFWQNTGERNLKVVEKIKSYIQKHDLNQRLLVSEDDLDSTLFSNKLAELNNTPFVLFVTHGDSVVFWSSDKVSFEPFVASKFVSVSYKSYPDGFYRVCSRTDKQGYSHYALLKLSHHFPVKVHSLPHNKSERKIKVDEQIILSGFADDNSYIKIKDELGRAEFYVKIIRKGYAKGVSVWLYVTALILVLFLLTHLLVSKSTKSHYFHTTLFFLILILIGLRIAIAKGFFLSFLSEYPIFSPELFAHSGLASSLGEHFLNLLVICLIFLFFSRLKINYKGSNPYLILLIFGVSLAGFLYWQLLELRHLIFDSNINFDPIKIDELNIYTLLGVMLIGVYFLLLFVYSLILSKSIQQIELTTNRIYLLVSLSQVIALIVVLFFSDKIAVTPFLVFFWILLSLSVMGFIQNQSGKRGDWAKALLLLSYSLFISFQVNTYLEDKEKEFRKLFAYKMLYERDLEVEMKLLEAEQKLEQNNVFESCIYEDSAFNKDEFEEILKYDYLIDFLSDFEISIQAFSGSASTWSSDRVNDYQRLYNMFLETSGDDLSNKFLKVREGSGFSGYISAHTSGSYNDNGFRSVFILLRQKVRSSKQVVSEFTGRTNTVVQNPYNYYHALYTNNVLNRVSPEFPFERFNSIFRPGMSEKFEEKDGLSFFIYNPEKGRLLVLVRSLRSKAEVFTVFSGLILIFFTAWFLYISLRFLIRIIGININRLKNKSSIKKFEVYFPAFKSILLQSKIRTALFLQLILSFVVGTIMVANFISNNHSSNQQKLILEKVRGISVDIEKSGKMDFSTINGPKKEFLINLSESYNIDINLFDLSGNLWVSSSPNLYSYALINKFMNPHAYVQLAEKQLFSYNQNERIYGFTYRSYYQSLFDRNQQLVGYIHLPFFARQVETNRELTSLLVNIVNIFVVFFFITGLLSVLLSKVITRPLSIIVSSLSKLKIDGKNEQIDWYSSDEIGQLVKTYNKVVSELEKSIEKLAATEREGAWKEMAKQVAHEIKNPLTPMRLSVQHLQRSVHGTDPDVQEKIKKVSELLVNQIDMMSKMAEEFSSFAKMPAAKPEKIEVNKLIEEVVQLFDKFEDFDISIHVLDTNVAVLADKDQLKRVFVNLLKNAHQAKIEDQKCQLLISLLTEEDNLLLSFSDNGVGISNDLKDKIFTPNFSTKTSGMGLGLAISKKIIELLGGTIWFESVQGKGTTFYIRLPIYKN